jgi:hypothetical protein
MPQKTKANGASLKINAAKKVNGKPWLIPS